jgi:hypothetical protein
MKAVIAWRSYVRFHRREVRAKTVNVGESGGDRIFAPLRMSAGKSGEARRGS